MTVWYVDADSGTDSNSGVGAGDSFATRRKKLTNLTAASLAPGDAIRVMGSPDPTSLGTNTATWTNGPIGDSITPTSSTNATPIVVTKVGHGLTTGDAIIFTGHTTNTKANGVWDVTVSGDTFTLLNADGSNSVGNGVGGETGTFRKITTAVVKLTSAVTANVACSGNRGVKANWTASANVTATVVTSDYKEGGECQQLAIAAGFTTGLAAYFPTGTINLSGYKQLSFWIKQTVGTVGAAGACTFTLCSDTAGATPVNTFNIPALGGTGAWTPVTVDLGTALGSSIQSIAFNVVTDNAAQTFLIDNIIACKDSTVADAISLQSLIGKNNATGDFWSIQSINGTRVMLDSITSTIPTTQPASGYFGTTETVTSYKRETTKTVLAASASIAVQSMNDSGTAGSTITISGGWNRTDMSTQTGETYLDGLNGYGYAVQQNTLNYLDFSKINFVRYNRGYSSTGGTNNTFDVTNQISVTTGFYDSGALTAYTGKNALNCSYAINISGDLSNYNLTSVYGSGAVAASAALLLGGIGNTVSVTGDIWGAKGTSYGINATTAQNCKVFAGNVKGFSYGAYFSAAINNIIYDAVLGNNSTSSVRSLGTADEKNYLVRCQLLDTTEIASAAAGYFPSAVFVQGKDSDPNAHLIERGTYAIQSQTAVRHTAADIAWQVSPKNTTYVTSAAPAVLQLASVAVAASTLVTASVWLRRDNTGLTARLMCKGKQILGVATDVSTAMTAAINTWEQVTITFTPSEAGVVDLTVECWGGTTYNAYIDDFDVSQA